MGIQKKQDDRKKRDGEQEQRPVTEGGRPSMQSPQNNETEGAGTQEIPYTGRPLMCRPQPMSSFPHAIIKIGLFGMIVMIALRLRLHATVSFGKVMIKINSC